MVFISSSPLSLVSSSSCMLLFIVFRRCAARDSIKLLTRPPPGRGSRTDGNSYLPPGKLNVIVSLLPGLLHVRYASHRAEVLAMPPLRFRIGISGFQRFSNDARYCAFFFYAMRYRYKCRLPVFCSGKHGNLFKWIIKD